jgi:hypothetical protein
VPNVRGLDIHRKPITFDYLAARLRGVVADAGTSVRILADGRGVPRRCGELSVAG